MEIKDVKQLEKSSRKSGLLSLAGILIFISSLVYASVNLDITNNKLEKSEKKISEMSFQIDSLNLYYKKINERIENIKDDEKKLTSFLIHLIQSSYNQNVGNRPEIDWEELKTSLINIPSGKRKTAVFISLLMNWKEIPFELGKQTPSNGFDSPSFMSYVIEQVGINIDKSNNQFLSSSMMEKFQKVDRPLPGDLIFFKGQTGNFGLVYICDCAENGKGVGIGTLQSISPLSLYELENINTEVFPLIGYYRVNYEDHE